MFALAVRTNSVYCQIGQTAGLYPAGIRLEMELEQW